jgi:hypothetical protein
VANTTNQAVTWYVQEGAAGGTVTSAGAYTAPATAGTYHVVATSQADTTKYAVATVTVTAPAPVITVSVNPSAATVTAGGSAAFTATVANTTNQAVNWSVQEGAAGGTVTSAGAYTAPATAGTYHVVATSLADTTKAAVATVTVTAPPPLAVSVTPSSASIAAGAALTFSATVSNSSNQAVTWSVQEGSVGGSVTSGGLYTAPSTAGTYHVVATSSADPSKSASGSVTVGAPASAPPPSSTAPCATAPLRASSATADHGYGTVHYFCSNGGSDSNDGLSPSTPKASWSAAVSTFNSMNSGDTVALCRGGSWTVSTAAIANPRCTAAATCDFRDYGSGARPIINFTTGAYPNTGVLFSIQAAASGYRFWNLDLQNGGNGEIDFYLYGGITDLDICDVNAHGGYIHFYDVGSGGTRNARFTIRNSTFSNAAQQSYLGASSDLLIDSNVFTDNGAAATCTYGSSYFCHQIYMQGENSGTGQVTTNERITNNQFVMTGSNCGGVMITAHGNHSSTLLENNVFQSGAGSSGYCAGVGFGQSGNCTYGIEQWDHLTIRRNRFFMPGGPGSTAISVQVAPYATIVDNVIAMGQGNGIEFPSGPQNGSGCTNPETTYGVVRNNTIYSAGAGWALIYGANEGTGHVVTNNAIWMGDGECEHSTPTGSFFAANSHANNTCRVTSGAAANTWWKNPSANAGDFTLVAGSPLIGAGNGFSNCAVQGVANQGCWDPLAMKPSQWTWSATDQATTRTAPVDVGAYSSR